MNKEQALIFLQLVDIYFPTLGTEPPQDDEPVWNTLQNMLDEAYALCPELMEVTDQNT